MRNDPFFASQVGAEKRNSGLDRDPFSASLGIEALLGGDRNPLTEFGQREAAKAIEASGVSPLAYDFYAVRRSSAQGPEIFGPKNIHVGNYPVETLYGIAGSPVVRFRSALESIKPRVDRAVTLREDEIEYIHQTALIWSEISALKEFIGTSEVISEIVAELRTARFQFIGKDTPIEVLKAVLEAIRAVTASTRFDTALVDQIVGVLQQGGIDSFAPDALRKDA